jgi:hypothetical protein
MIGVGLIAWGVVGDRFSAADVRTIGVTILMMGVIRASYRASKPASQAEIYLQGYDAGYRNGNYDGRRTPLVLVPPLEGHRDDAASG